jgi:deoxyribonuclease V
MHIDRPTYWPHTPAEASALQRSLRDAVERVDRWDPVHCVAGLDVGLENGNSRVRAAVAVLDFPGLQRVDQSLARRPVEFPYIPGLLSFREVPVLLDALEGLRVTPDLLLCDGQGLAHPRRFGIACHLGVLTGLPSVGVAKSRLVGEHDPLGPEKGDWQPLRYQGEVVGAVLRTRTGVQPLYVSIGHRVSLASALDFVLRCCTRYRLPETTRHAHRLASGSVSAA